MKSTRKGVIVLIFTQLFFFSISAFSLEITLDTSSLDLWKSLDFPKIPEHSNYNVVIEDGLPAIRIDSDGSASALIYSKTFSLKETRYLSWTWKVMNVFQDGNAKLKKGDDYPIRVFVMFPYSKDRIPFLQRAPFELAKTLYGEYPPSEIINYVWGNRIQAEEPLPNVHIDRAMMFFPDKGVEFIGQWREHSIDIAGDFRRAFNSEPPDSFTLAIMGDSDNTGSQSVSFIRDIKFTDR